MKFSIPKKSSEFSKLYLNFLGVTAIRRRYGGANNAPLEAITLQGAGHFLSLGGTLAELAARFMGLIK